MSDIVERLRAWADDLSIGRKCLGADQDMREAAAEIERLRKELSETALTALSIDSRAMDLQLLYDRQATRLAEAVEVMKQIEWSNDSKWQSDCARAFLAKEGRADE